MSKKGRGKAEKAAPEGSDGLTGSFVGDFPIHCEQQGLPPVPARPLLRAGAPPTGDTTPSVLVEEDAALGPHSLRAIHLRNLLLDGRLLAALSLALEGTQLTAISLWNVGLSEATTSQLLSLAASCAVRRLVLDGNEVSSTHVVSLLQSPCIEQLSLKCCCLGDAFCEVISPALASSSLLSLDLSSNQITDEGAGHLARALRLNRTLLSLCLAGNRVGDEGVRALCEVLVRFPLTREEDNLRRSLLTATTVELPVTSSSRSSSGAGLDKSGRGKGRKKEDSGKASVAGKGGRGAKTGGGKKAGKGEGSEEPSAQPVGVAGGSGQPLLDLVKEEEGQLWMSGNSSLAHLTLSCNRVGVRGVASLLNVLHDQQNSNLLPVTSDLSCGGRTAGTGLLRITLEHNCMPSDCREMEEMRSLMRSCDPLATATSPPPPQTLS